MKVARWLMGKFPSPVFRRPIRPLPIEEVRRIRDALEAIGYACPVDPKEAPVAAGAGSAG